MSSSRARVSRFAVGGVVVVGIAYVLSSARPSNASSSPQTLVPIVCERRTPIHALPFAINRCGSYFVTKCLTGVSGQHGITVNATNVTLDLNGFALRGVAGSLDGIHITGGDRRGVRVHSGTISGWGGDGVDAGAGTSFSNEIVLEEVGALENSGHGFNCGSETTVLDCSANGNGMSGIVVGGGSVVRRTLIRDNDLHGIVTENDCWITENYIDDQCSGSGIRVTSGSTTLQGNTIGDCMIGIDVSAAGNLVVQNRVTDSVCGGTKYSIAGGNLVGPISSDPATAGPWANFDF